LRYQVMSPVVGFDDIEIAQILNPSLTTVQTPGETMGRVAFERLLDLMDDGDQSVEVPIKWTIPTKLVMRDLCASAEGE